MNEMIKTKADGQYIDGERIDEELLIDEFLIDAGVGAYDKELDMYISRYADEAGKTVRIALFDDAEFTLSSESLIALAATFMGINDACFFRLGSNGRAAYLKFENDTDGTVVVEYCFFDQERAVEPSHIEQNAMCRADYPSEEEIKNAHDSGTIRDKSSKTEQAAITMYLVRRVAQAWSISVDEALSLLRASFRAP